MSDLESWYEQTISRTAATKQAADDDNEFSHDLTDSPSSSHSYREGYELGATGKNLDEERAKDDKEYLQGFEDGRRFGPDKMPKDLKDTADAKLYDALPEHGGPQGPTQALENKKSSVEIQPVTDLDQVIASTRSMLEDECWFDGTSRSVVARIQQLTEIEDGFLRSTSANQLQPKAFTTLVQLRQEVQLQREELERLSSNYIDPEQEDYLANLPQKSAGFDAIYARQDLGEDDGSFLFKEAKKIQDEADNYDWDEFVHLGSQLWVEDQIPTLLISHQATKQAAYDYAIAKTGAIFDVEDRVDVIERFMDLVEQQRQGKQADKTAGIYDQEENSYPPKKTHPEWEKANHQSDLGWGTTTQTSQPPPDEDASPGTTTASKQAAGYETYNDIGGICDNCGEPARRGDPIVRVPIGQGEGHGNALVHSSEADSILNEPHEDDGDERYSDDMNSPSNNATNPALMNNNSTPADIWAGSGANWM